MSLNIDLSQALTESVDYTSNSSDVYGSNLALNLESVTFDEVSEIDLDSVIENAIEIGEVMVGMGFAAETVLNVRKLNSIMEAVRPVVKTVVRQGKIKSKVVCPEGFKFADGTCKKMTQRDIIAFSKRARKAAKKRLRNKSGMALAAKRRKKSMLVRKRNLARMKTRLL